MIHVSGKTNIKEQASPKSPYPPNSMSDSVAHIVTNAGDIRDTKKKLEQEILDRKAGDQQLADDIASIEQTFPILDEAIQNLEEADAATKNALDKEKSEREAFDTALQQNIDNEAKTRENADDKLRSDLDEEITRAKTTEQSIADQVNDVVNEYDEHFESLDSSVSSLTTSLDTLSKKEKADVQTLSGEITAINDKIPSQASSENQLADKDFVNSSISTATAVFRGTVQSLGALKTLTGDLNDYAYVETIDETTGLILKYDRYKYSEVVSEETGNWAFEYTLNNSSFTSDQWKAITSGITSELVTQITINKNAIAQETADRQSSDDSLQKNLDAEVTRAKNTEQTISEAVNDYINETDEHLETLDDSVSSLTTSIDDLSKKEAADVLGIQTSLATEIDDREKADNTLQSNLDAEAERTKEAEKTLTDDLSAEASTRENADTTLQSNIDAEVQRATDKEKELSDSLVSGLAEEKKAREDADNLLQSNINAEASTRETNDNTLQTNINEEASERKKADETLQSDLASETARAKEAEEKLTTDLSTEATTRETNDSALQSNIDAEATRAKDAEKTLTDDLTAEASTRQTNDEALQSNIDAEAKTRGANDNVLQSNLDEEIERAKTAEGTLTKDLASEISAREAGDSDTLTASKAYTDQEKANYVLKKGDTMTGTLNVPTINNYNVSTAVSIATGTHADSYFQSKKFRGQGNAGTYNHAIDFGYAGHDRVDFYEYGGIWNFWKNNQSTAVTDKATKLALTIGLDSLSNKSYTYTWPNKTGTFALTDDVEAEAKTREKADTELQQGLTDEITRAEKAEGQLTLDISTEKTRAEGAESDLNQAILTLGTDINNRIDSVEAEAKSLDCVVGTTGDTTSLRENGTYILIA